MGQYNYPDAIQGGQVYAMDARAIVLPTELHQGPGVSELGKGERALLNHFSKYDFFKEHGDCDETKFIPVLYDAVNLVPPIKAHEQAGRRSTLWQGF